MATKNQIDNGLSGVTGSGSFVGSTSPTLVTPALGTPSSGTLTNCNGLPATALIGAFNIGGRLTLTSGLPVTITDVTSATSIYFTPYKTNLIPLFDGSSTWNILSFNEITISVPASTSQMYDVFAYNNSGSVACETAAWSSDTSRTPNFNLALQNGIYVKSGATTRRYIGSFRTTTVSGQTEDSLTKRYVWNYNNRVLRPMSRSESTASWNYSTATWRQANNSTSNQLDFVIGVSEDAVNATARGAVTNSTSTGRAANTAIGLDITNASSSNIFIGTTALNSTFNSSVAYYEAIVSEGRHFLAWLESADGTDTQTWYGTKSSGSQCVTGIFGYLMG